MSASGPSSSGNGDGDPSAPGTGSTNHSGVMDCSSDPAHFTLVSIHTAKCAKCDKRNMDKMRRCPGCTYQVCQPCFDNMHGAPLTHGNVGSSPAGINATPVRRRLFARAGAPSPPTSASHSAVPSSGGLGPDVEGPLTETSTPGNGGIDQAADTTKVGAGDTSAGAQEPTAQQTPRSSVKRTRKGKVTTPIVDHSSSEDDSILDLESPTPAQKRLKPVSEMNVEVSGDKLANTVYRRKNKAQLTNINAGSPALTTIQPVQPSPARNSSMLGTDHTLPGTMVAGLPTQSNDEDEDMDDDEILGREKGEGTIQQLLEKHGVDTPGNRYKEHLLSRYEPVRFNPTIPLNLGHSHRPRPGVAKMEKNLQDGVAQKLQKMHDSAGGARQGNFGMTGQGSVPKISEFVNDKAAEVVQDLKLTEDQEAAVKAHAMASASLLIVKFNSQQAVGAQHPPKLELSTSSVGRLTPAMVKEMEEKIESDIVLVLNHFNPPEKDEIMGAGNNDNKPTGVHSGLKLNSPGALPPVGKFQVSPVRPRSGPFVNRSAVQFRPLPSSPSIPSSPAIVKQGRLAYDDDEETEDEPMEVEDDLQSSPTPLNPKQRRP